MKVGLLVAAMLVTATACAADTTIFGFELGKPLVLPECPHKTLGSIPRKMYSAIPPMTCAQDAHELNGYGQPVREIVFSEKEAPSIVKNWRAFPLEVGGNLVGFHFITDGAEAQSAVMAALQKKYGKPEYSKTHGVQNSFGAQFDAAEASWHSGPVQVIYIWACWTEWMSAKSISTCPKQLSCAGLGTRLQPFLSGRCSQRHSDSKKPS